MTATTTRKTMLRIRQPYVPLGLLLLFSTMTITLLAVQSTSAESQPRQLQLTEMQTATSDLTLQFSIWFPDEPVDQRETFVELLNDFGVFNPVRAAILNGLETMLCSAQENGTCTLKPGTPNQRSRQRHLQETTPSVLKEDPAVEVRRRSREEFSWTVWTVSYPVLEIGEDYLLEALMNEPFLAFDDLDRAAVEAMQQVAQLEVELAIMQGDFDDILQDNLRGIVPRVYSSPIRKEFETFEAISQGQIDGEENPPLDPRIWYPLRACGAGLLVMSIGIYVFLLVLASRRRDQIKLQEQESRSIVLESAEGVSHMLTQSAAVGGDDGSVSEASMARSRAARVRRRSSFGSGAQRRRPSGDGFSVASRASRASHDEEDDSIATRIRLPGTLQIS